LKRAVFFSVFVATASAGCSQQAEKPPPVTCRGRCAPINPPVIVHVPGPGPDGGAGGDSGESDEPVRLLGTVLILNDVPALAASPLTEPAELLVEGSSGDVTGRYDGNDPFSLDGVKRAPTTWALVTPGPGDMLRTLQPIDTSRPNEANELSTTLTVVRESELVRAFSVISLPIMPNASAAQAVLVVQKDGKAVAGVRVSALSADAVIYVDNGGFSDTVTSTDGSGIVVLANVPASSWPGSGVPVTLSGAVTGRWDIRVVSGGVTFAGIGE
jgi:hypothetical protein